MPTKTELKLLQSLPLEVKIQKTRLRIREFVEEFGEAGVYISFSGGKDSTVLLHIIRQMYPDMPAVFADTGLEYPAIRQFVKAHENVTWVKPQMMFRDVMIKYGYPVIGKEVANYVWVVRHAKDGPYKEGRLARLKGTFRNKDGNLSIYNRPRYQFLLHAPFEISDICCKEMKKKPISGYAKTVKRHPIMATMAEESQLRKGKWLKSGCNSFQGKNPNSTPMSFWREQDVLRYLFTNHDDILNTIACGAMKHPWAACYGDIVTYIRSDEIEGQISMAEVLEYDHVCKYRTTKCKRTGCIFCLFGITQDRERLLKVQREEPLIADYVLRGGTFNEQGMWQPDQQGLGFWFVTKWLGVHGDIHIPVDGWNEYEKQYGTENTKVLLEHS